MSLNLQELVYSDQTHPNPLIVILIPALTNPGFRQNHCKYFENLNIDVR